MRLCIMCLVLILMPLLILEMEGKGAVIRLLNKLIMDEKIEQMVTRVVLQTRDFLLSYDWYQSSKPVELA